MSDRLEIRVHRLADLPQALAKVGQFTKAWAFSGCGIALIVESLKTRAQERLYHSCFRDLSRDCLLGGFKQDEEAWKRALLQAFFEVTRDDPEHRDDWKGREPRLIPDLYGRGMLMIGVESKRFTKGLAKAFITFVHTEGDSRGVRWSRTSLGRDAPQELFEGAAA